ncbi:MAG: cupin domain-containing protein [Candidatus Omnitrophica bacterium]|nr:cupin domain-containing protein [Candidatus Omnitrophota bacterium]
MEIGKIIRSMRKQKRMTLKDLSEKSRVALATLSRMETGKMIGTVKSHSNIAGALDVTLTDLYSGFEIKSQRVEMRPHKEKPDVFIHNDKAFYDILTKKVLSKKMMPVMLRLEKGAKTADEQSHKGTEKFLYILSGHLQANVDGKTYLLKEGDSFYFDASLPHCWKNTSNKPAKALCVITPATL